LSAWCQHRKICAPPYSWRRRDPNNVTPIRQIQMARFDGKSWVLFGDVLGER
jgi:hypothetical protein